MSLIDVHTEYGRRIKSDGEIVIFERSEIDKIIEEKERYKADLEMIGKSFGILMEKYYALIGDKDGINRLLNTHKYIIRDSVLNGFDYEGVNERLYWAGFAGDLKPVAMEYNRVTVQMGMSKGWSADKIYQYLKDKGSKIKREQVDKYMEGFSKGRGQSKQ